MKADNPQRSIGAEPSRSTCLARLWATTNRMNVIGPCPGTAIPQSGSRWVIFVVRIKGKAVLPAWALERL